MDLYKSLRALFRHGRVYHLSPPPDGSLNDALQIADPDSGRSAVFVYRQEGLRDEERLYPRGLRAERWYRVRLEEAGGGSIASGRDLMERGIVVPMPRLFYAEIVHLEPVE